MATKRTTNTAKPAKPVKTTSAPTKKPDSDAAPEALTAPDGTNALQLTTTVQEGKETTATPASATARGNESITAKALAELSTFEAVLAEFRTVLNDAGVNDTTKERLSKLLQRGKIALGYAPNRIEDAPHWIGVNLGRLLDLDLRDMVAVGAFRDSMNPPPSTNSIRQAAEIVSFIAGALFGKAIERWDQIAWMHQQVLGDGARHARVLAEVYEAVWAVDGNPDIAGPRSRALISRLGYFEPEFRALDPAWVEKHLARARVGKKGTGHGAGNLGPARVAAALAIKCNVFDLGKKTEKQAGDVFAKHWTSPAVSATKSRLEAFQTMRGANSTPARSNALVASTDSPISPATSAEGGALAADVKVRRAP